MKSCWYPAIIAGAIGLGSGAALAQFLLSKPIRAFIPFAAGSATISCVARLEPLGSGAELTKGKQRHEDIYHDDECNAESACG